MNESDVKRDIVKAVRAEDGYARRIEDRFSVGMPDLVLMPVRCPVVWAEAKIVLGYIFGPTRRQLIELQKLHRPPYSISMMIGWKDGKLFISAPKIKIHLEQCDKQEDGETVSDFIRRSLSHV